MDAVETSMAKSEAAVCVNLIATRCRWRTGTVPSTQNGSNGPYLGASRYQRPAIEGPPATFQTVSQGVFSEALVHPFGCLCVRTGATRVSAHLLSRKLGGIKEPGQLDPGS